MGGDLTLRIPSFTRKTVKARAGGAGGATSGAMSQTFDTLIGITYNVNYVLTTQQFAGAIPIQVALVEALNGSTILNSVTNSFNQPAGIWNSVQTLSFTATSGSTTLRFTDQTTPANSGPVNWGLDVVTVAAVGGSAVPEPATYALMGLGLGILSLPQEVLIGGQAHSAPLWRIRTQRQRQLRCISQCR